MTELSDAAQAVFNAYIQGLATKRRNAIAAALRAAVREVAPLSTNRKQNEIREALLAIATELEGFN